MELHHKLRRDPSWHPSACNICGQLGHQAAQCTTGTVNWQAMYGENAFKLRKAVFQSDLDAIKKARQIDFAELERSAKEYAKVRLENPQLRQAPPPQQHSQQPPAAAAVPMQQAASAAPDRARQEDEQRKKAAEAAAGKPQEEPLPEGWGVAYDAQGKPYYWHKQTKKVQWDKPIASTPIN